ncbi:MAG: S-layer homology domain-containing protein [Acidimicrobiales bacterium]
MRSLAAIVAVLSLAVSASPASAADPIDDFTPGPCIRNGGIGATPFVDLASGAFYRSAVAWAFHNKIVEGTDSTHYSPDATMTRGQFAAVLHRAVCTPEPTGTATFADLRVGAFYLDAVDWLVGEDLTTGITPTLFGPERTLTRGEFVTFLHRLVGEPTGFAASGFRDVPADAFYADAVDWAVRRGITTGTSATTFEPLRTLTRGEAVTFLYRLFTIGDVQAHFTTVLSGLSSPVGAAQNPATGTWFITEQGGTLVRWPGSGAATDVLTKSVSHGGEQGLLGVAFTADGARMYLSYTDPAGTSVVDEYVMSGDTPGAMREIIRVAQPFSNHNGGHVAIGPDGYLYVGLGDGGSANDPGNNGQSLDTLLGKILRIDPANPSGAGSTGSRPTTPSSESPGSIRSGSTACATRGGSRSTRPLVICGSAMWVRAPARRSTGSGHRTPARARTSDGGCVRARSRRPASAGPGRRVRSIRCTSTTGRVRSRSPVATSTAAAIPALEGTYLWSDYFESTLRGWRDPYGVESAAITPIGVGPPRSRRTRRVRCMC